MAIIPSSKRGLTVARDLLDLLLLLLILVSIVSQSEVVYPVLVLAVLYLLGVRGALQRHPESFTPLEKKSIFTTRCAATGVFLLGSVVYAFAAQDKLAWIFLAGVTFFAPASLYFGYRDLYINQT